MHLETLFTRHWEDDFFAINFRYSFVSVSTTIINSWIIPVIVHITYFLDSDWLDRLLIIVTSVTGTKQFSEIPKLKNGTKSVMVEAFPKTLEEWNIDKLVEAMYSDRNSSNTSAKNGACIGLPMKLGKDLIYLSCRH